MSISESNLYRIETSSKFSVKNTNVTLVKPSFRREAWFHVYEPNHSDILADLPGLTPVNEVNGIRKGCGWVMGEQNKYFVILVSERNLK